jgi:predicted transcriptional regulator
MTDPKPVTSYRVSPETLVRVAMLAETLNVTKTAVLERAVERMADEYLIRLPEGKP